MEIDIGADRLFALVNLEDFLSALDIGVIDRDLAVKSARTQQRRIQNIAAVGRGNDDDALVLLKAVHLNQQLVQRLLTFVVAAAETGASVSAHRVDLVDEDDRRRVLLCLLKEVAHTACTHADEHFHEVRTGDREERHACLSCDRSCEQRFTGTGRAEQQHAARDSRADILKLLGVLEEIDQLCHFRLFLVRAGHIGEGRLLCRAGRCLDIGSAEGIDLSAAVCLTEHHHKQHDRHDHQHGSRHDGQQPAVIRHFIVVLHQRFIRMRLIVALTVFRNVLHEQRDARHLIAVNLVLVHQLVPQLAAAEVECIFADLAFIEQCKNL